MKKTEEKFAQEYKDFLNQDLTDRPHASISELIRNEVLKDLDPSWISVMSKLLFIHMIMSSVTLIFCPQFGLGPIGGGHGLMHFVESYGQVACGAFCGSLFFFGSVLLASLVFSPAQKRKIFNSTLAFFSVLAFFSMGALILISMMNNGAVPHLHLEFMASWLVSGVGICFLVTKMTMKPALISNN